MSAYYYDKVQHVVIVELINFVSEIIIEQAQPFIISFVRELKLRYIMLSI